MLDREVASLVDQQLGEVLAPDGATRIPFRYAGYQRGQRVEFTFRNGIHNQRAGLLLVGNMLCVGVGGTCSVPGYRGLVLGFDTTRLSEQTGPASAFVPAPGGGAGVWGAGGPASDGRSIFVATGNDRAALRAGTPDAMRSFGDAVVRLGLDLSLDHHACFGTSSPTGACGAGEEANLRNVFMPRNAELLARDRIEDNDPDGDIGSPDLDFGSTGVVLVPPAAPPENQGLDDGRNLLAAGGKDGLLYLVDRDRMGGIGPSPLRTAEDFPRLGGAELHGLAIAPHSASGGIRGTPAYFEGRSGRYLYTRICRRTRTGAAR